MKQKQEANEFQRFDRTMEELLKVPHSEIKAKLDEEKQRKRATKKKPTPLKKPESG